MMRTLKSLISNLNIALVNAFLNDGKDKKLVKMLDGGYSTAPLKKRNAQFVALLERARQNSFVQECVRKIIIRVLPLLNPKKNFGPELFHVIAEYSWMVAIEVICFRRDVSGGIQIFLSRRDKNESAYPGMLHCPGTIFRPQDVDLKIPEGLFERLSDFDGSEIQSYSFINVVYCKDEERGPLASLIYLVDSKDQKESSHSKWYDLEEILKDPLLIGTHKNIIIPMGLEVFKKSEKIS